MTQAHLLGAAAGALLALGLLQLTGALTSPAPPSRRKPRLGPMLAAAGLSQVSSGAFLAGSAAAAMVATLTVAAATGVAMAALLAGVVGGCVPLLVVRRRARANRESVRACWPEAVDALVSGVRAGLSLPEALGSLATVGPGPLRPVFSVAALEYRATGSFDEALDALQARAADPVADRVVVALRLAREFGGSQVGEVLRTLATMVREDARVRGEIRGRQSWTISAARMAVAAPWLTLLLLCTRPEAVAAFTSSAGAFVLAIAAILTVMAYAVMLRVGRLPEISRLTP